MSLDDPVVITCSISGSIANREQCPAIPYTPEQYASEARRIVDEGGVHIHIHARKPDGTPSYEIEDFVAIRDAITACDLATIEIHLSNVYRREPFRHHSTIADIVVGRIMGFGAEGYLMALRAAKRLIEAQHLAAGA